MTIFRFRLALVACLLVSACSSGSDETEALRAEVQELSQKVDDLNGKADDLAEKVDEAAKRDEAVPGAAPLGSSIQPVASATSGKTPSEMIREYEGDRKVKELNRRVDEIERRRLFEESEQLRKEAQAKREALWK